MLTNAVATRATSAVFFILPNLTCIKTRGTGQKNIAMVPITGRYRPIRKSTTSIAANNAPSVV
ncbi:MAG: hypothetical protein ACD_47C00434G0001 [uncultured bacterium]|nr:MAG: hypothetical protein ACD_47C00434G0001 [uncultured bacterium]